MFFLVQVQSPSALTRRIKDHEEARNFALICLKVRGRGCAARGLKNMVKFQCLGHVMGSILFNIRMNQWLSMPTGGQPNV